MLHCTKHAKKGVLPNPFFPYTHSHKRFEFLSISGKKEKPVFWCILLKFLDYTKCSFLSSLEISLTEFF